jgi:hypothetical protein
MSASRVAVVQEMYQRLGAGDLAGARAMWTEDGVWHVTGDHEIAGDYDPDAYFHMLGRWAQQYPSYTFEFRDARDIGEDIATIVVESANGMAPEAASGLLVYRVVDGQIMEGWAIPAFASGKYAF